MLREFLAVFCVSYLYAAVLLLPVHLYYFTIGSRRLPQSWAHRMHKWMLVVTLSAPLLLSIATYSWEPTGFSGAQPDSYRPSGAVAPINGNDAEADGARAEQVNSLDAVQDYHQMVWGMLYYLIDIVAVLILTGLIVFLVRALVQRLYTGYLERSSCDRCLYRGCLLLTTDHITLPFSTGLAVQKVFLPRGLDSDEAEIILRHEMNHFSKRHHYWSLVESVALHLYWFNPVSHLMYQKGALLREMECDMATIQTVDRYTYSRALLKTAVSMLPSGRLGFMVQRWAQRKALKTRVENILSESKRPRRLIAFGFFLVLAVFAGAFAFLSLLDNETVEKSLVEKVRAEYGKVLGGREGVSLDQVPDHLVRVLVFNEDTRFYGHEGVDVKAAFRAVVNNLTGGSLQGASTITQQLSKALCVSNREHSLRRKLRQVRAARVIERHFSKEQILEMYLNSVYFGQGAWGVATASRRFFGHPAAELTVAESAMLVQSLSRPSDHNCIADPRRAVVRTRRLLQRMVARQQADAAEAQVSLSEVERRLGTGSAASKAMSSVGRLALPGRRGPAAAETKAELL